MNCLFCDFVSGKKKYNLDGKAFVSILETKYCWAFLSMQGADHALLIPKKHVMVLENLENKIALDLMKQLMRLGIIMSQQHDGYNILLNNGKIAGQQIPHLHIHVIPRDVHPKKFDFVERSYWWKKKLKG